MNVLVTGMNGFTGQYVRDVLFKNMHTVTPLQSDITNYEDVGEEVRVTRPDAVIHLAGVSFVGHDNTASFYNVNIIGTLNLLTAIEKYAPNVSSILLVSSGNIYGNNTESLLTEKVVPKPENDYAVSKYAMELMSLLRLDKLPIFIVRPFNYTGKGQNERFVIPKIVTHFKQRNCVVELGNIEVLREFGDVRAVAQAYVKLLELSPVGEIINVCTGITFSLREVISICENITGQKMEISVNPKYIRKNEVKVLAGDNSRLVELIGEMRMPSLEQTLRWMLG